MVTIYNGEELKEVEKRSIEDCYIIGKLADDGYHLPQRGVDPGKSVSFTNFSGPDKVVFYIENLSTEPSLLQEKLGKSHRDVYVTFDHKNRGYLERFKYSDIPEDERVNFIREHFVGKLILFKPRINYERNREKYHYNLEILLAETNEEDTFSEFIPVPSIKKGMTHNRFENMLRQELPFELPMYNHSLEIPEFIVCDRYIYLVEDYAAIEQYEARNNLYICRNPESVKRIPLPDDWYHEWVKFPYQDISFIKTKTKIDLNRLFDENGDFVFRERKKEDKNEVVTNTNDELSKSEISESQFLDWLRRLADNNKLTYEFHDLINFHTSLKTSRFSILGGMSGTGKSQLARLYAEAVGMEEGDNLLVVPISPSFTEPSDVLGFLNQQTGIYMESETGIVSFLHSAHQNPDKLFMLVLDEMNLGQVEHYFSPFISLLEDRKNRVLKLYSDRSFTHQPELREIPIGQNVLFVGTANFDETTKDFSNRMLDRSNVIILEKKSFLEAKSEEEYQTHSQNNSMPTLDPIRTNTFFSWIKAEKGLQSLTDNELAILDSLHKEISNFDAQTGVSFRIAKNIGHYLENIPCDEAGNDLLSREIAFDYQIKQRILTKIRGHREQIESLVGRMEDEDTYHNGKLGYILSEEEEFQVSRKYLLQKAKELMRNGYTL